MRQTSLLTRASSERPRLGSHNSLGGRVSFADGSTLVGLYESSGKAVPGVRVKLRVKVISAEESNLLEDAGRKLSVSSDTLEFLGAYEIKTFKLRLQALLSARPPTPSHALSKQFGFQGRVSLCEQTPGQFR